MTPGLSYVHPAAGFALGLDGRDITARARPRLISLTLTEKRGAEADELQIELDDSDGRTPLPPMGASVTLSLGWGAAGEAPASLVDKGRFTIDESGHQGAPDRVVVRARSADLTRAFRIRRLDSWSGVTLGQVLADIAARHGLQAQVAAELAAIPVAHLEQGRESDSALLARLGRQHDALATVKAGRLLFAPASADTTPGGTPIPSAVITRDKGDSHRFRHVERGAYTGVVAEWQDRAGARRRQEVAGDDENALRLGRTYGSAEAARRAAQAEWTRLERGKAEFSLVLAQGRPDLYPQRRVSVSGFKAEIDAETWLIDEAVHALNDRGLTTTLRMERGS